MGYIGCKNPCSVTAEDINEIAAMTRRPTYNQDRSRCTEPSKNDQTAIGNLHVLANLKVHWICVDPEPEPLSLVTLVVQSLPG